jgi:hypothetical protein
LRGLRAAFFIAANSLTAEIAEFAEFAEKCNKHRLPFGVRSGQAGVHKGNCFVKGIMDGGGVVMASYPVEIRRCRHIRTNGTQCGSPALKKKRFCYYHEQNQPRAVMLYIDGERYPDAEFMLPVFEDAHSIQTALRQVVQLMFERRIDRKDAGLMLYALQIASGNLKRMEGERAKPTQVVVEPAKAGRTPLGMTPWSASGQGHDPEEEDNGHQESAVSRQPSAISRPEKPEEETREEEVLREVREARAGAPASCPEEKHYSFEELLQFHSDRVEYRPPFCYLKQHPDQPLCPKCFAEQFAVGMGEPGEGCEAGYRRCGLCKSTVKDPGAEGGEVVASKTAQADASLPG